MSTTAKVYSIASVPGDGIGVEVVDAAITVLTKIAALSGIFKLDFVPFDWNSENYKKRGYYIPEGGLDELKKHDAILFGAVGALDVPDHISLWGLILPIRKSLDQYINLRPVKILPTLQSPLRNCAPEDLDWVFVRENSEGEYAGQGGTTHGDEHELATDVSIYTYRGIERCMRFAFELAKSRPRKQLTMVTKSNAQRHGMVLWDRVFAKLVPEYPDVKTDKMIVDAMTVRMVLHPSTLDTIVATNLHGDILTDLAAALAGSIGVAPSSNLSPDRKNPSMFEPIHGSAFQIIGKGIANPVGTFWCAAEMLRWLGETKAGDALMKAIEDVTASGVKTGDIGGKAKTVEVTEAIIKELEKSMGSGTS